MEQKWRHLCPLSRIVNMQNQIKLCISKYDAQEMLTTVWLVVNAVNENSILAHTYRKKKLCNTKLNFRYNQKNYNKPCAVVLNSNAIITYPILISQNKLQYSMIIFSRIFKKEVGPSTLSVGNNIFIASLRCNLRLIIHTSGVKEVINDLLLCHGMMSAKSAENNT